MGAVVKYNYHLLFLRGTFSLACLNTSIFHWKNRQIRLKIENIVAMETGMLTEERDPFLYITGHKQN